MLGKWLLIYCAASVVLTSVFSEIRGGHPHVPFTEFPDYLLISPYVPVGLLLEFVSAHSLTYAAYLALFIGAAALFWWLYTTFVERRGKPGPP